MLLQGDTEGLKEERRTLEIVTDENARYKECETQLDSSNHVSTIMDWAQAAGKATGLASNILACLDLLCRRGNHQWNH